MRSAFTVGVSVFVFLLFHGNGASEHSLMQSIYRNVDLLYDYHTNVDLGFFFLQKNDDFSKRYLVENNTELQVVFASYRDIVRSVWVFDFCNGLGRQGGGILFDPQRIDYGLIPSIEIGRLPVLARLGLDHHCFHQIDMFVVPTIYWNRIFLLVGSKNMQPFDYWRQFTDDNLWRTKNRLAWTFTGYYYMRSFFGMIDEEKINGQNDKVIEGALDVKYAFYRRYSWVMAARMYSLTGYWDNASALSTKATAYWRDVVELDALFRRGKQGGLLFVSYTLDGMPMYHYGGDVYDRLSRDRLLQVGVRFFR
jgi:hypothetical protein